MNHCSEEELTLHYCGEFDASPHLAACELCRTSLAELRAVLEVVSAAAVPEPSKASFWPGVEKQLPAKSSRPKWKLLGAIAAVLLMAMGAAFWAGRQTAELPTAQQPQLAKLSSEVKGKILRQALVEHLDRARIVLTSLQHEEAGSDISLLQSAASDLVSTNRIYRLAAVGTGDRTLAANLEDLERALLDVARAPARMDEEDWSLLQKRLADQQILFKVKVLARGTKGEQI